MLKLMKSLEEDYKVNIEHFLTLYREGETIEKMTEKLNVSTAYLRLISTLLHLRLKKKCRELDYHNLISKLNPESRNPKIEALEEEINYTLLKLVSAEKLNGKLGIENTILKKKVKAIQNDVYTVEHFETIIEQNAEMLSKLATNTPINVFPSQRTDPIPYEGLCAVLADLHIGDLTVAEETGGTGNYSYQIASNRLKTYAECILSYPYQSNTLTVFSLGDWINGTIHGGLNTTEESFVESLYKCTQILYDFLKTLSKVYSIIIVHAVGGNHGRVTENPAINKKYADYEYLIHKTVEKMLEVANVANVSIMYSKSGYIFETINEHKILAHHGDMQRSLNITNPKSVAELQAFCLTTFGDTFNSTVNGHFHNALTVSNSYGGMCIQAGSGCGTNTFSFVSGFPPKRASQPIFFIEESGDLDTVSHISIE